MAPFGCDKLTLPERRRPTITGFHVKNSIRLILAALIISGVTYAAAGSPAPTSVEASNTASALIALHTP